MSDWSNVQAEHVLSSMAECDRLGSREFRSRYRFGRSQASTVWHGGQEYDIKAVLGLALLHAVGRPATKEDFVDGEGATARMLTGMGFDVVVDQDAVEAEDRATAERARGAEAGEVTPAPSRAAKTSKTAAASPARRTAAVKAPAAPKRVTKLARPNPLDQPTTVCPTCFMALPLTGVCDNCA